MNDDEITPEEARQELAEWDGFTRHPGWARFMDELNLRAERALASVMRGGLDIEGYARNGALLEHARRTALIPDERAELLAALLPMEDADE